MLKICGIGAAALAGFLIWARATEAQGAGDSRRTRRCPGPLRPMPCDRPIGRKSVTESAAFSNRS
jgi:hypothetical protein